VCALAAVRYNGELLNELVLDEHTTFMQQANVLFDDTIRSNIVVGLDVEGSKVPHDDAAVKEACLTAQLWHDLPTLGGGLGQHAPVGYRGKALTGGQAQRVCLGMPRCATNPCALTVPLLTVSVRRSPVGSALPDSSHAHPLAGRARLRSGRPDGAGFVGGARGAHAPTT
jgi:hypothetical protein